MDNLKTGLIGLVTALVVFGGTVTLLPAEGDNTYYCLLSDQIAVFHRLSSSLKTGYYMVDDVEKSLACRDGMVYEEWISLRQYIEERGISWEDVITPPNNVDTRFSLVRGRQGVFESEYIDVTMQTYSRCYSGGLFRNYAGELICPV